MALKFRLSRMGSNKNPHYRIVVQESTSPRDSRFIEIIGYYNPKKEGAEKVSINQERYKYWYERGARPTESVSHLIMS